MIPNPANPQSLNRYSYCLNNPLRYNDPSGHDPKPTLAEKARAAAILYGTKVLAIGAAAAARSGNINMLVAIYAASPIVIGAFCDVNVPSNNVPEVELNELSNITGAPAGGLLLGSIDNFLQNVGPQKPTAVASFLLDPSLTCPGNNMIQFTMGVQKVQIGPGIFSYNVRACIDGTWYGMNKGAATPTLSGPIITTPAGPVITTGESQYSLTLATTSSLVQFTILQIQINVDYAGPYCNWGPSQINVDFKSGTVTTKR